MASNNVHVCGQLLMPYWFALVVQVASALVDFFIYLWQTRDGKKKEEPNNQLDMEHHNKAKEAEKKQGFLTKFVDFIIGVKILVSAILDVVAFVIAIMDTVGTTSSMWSTYQCIGVTLANSRVLSSFQSVLLVRAKQILVPDDDGEQEGDNNKRVTLKDTINNMKNRFHQFNSVDIIFNKSNKKENSKVDKILSV